MAAEGLHAAGGPADHLLRGREARALVMARPSRPKIDPRTTHISFFSPGSRGKACGTPISAPGSQGWSHLLRMDAAKRLARRRLEPKIE